MNKLDSQDHPPKLVDFALSTLTEALQLEFSRIAESKGLALEVEDGRHCVRSDPLLIEQILRNLLSNAIKYTNRGKVSLRCASAAGSMVRIEVLDTGIGISTDELPHIFDEFYRSRAGDYARGKASGSASVSCKESRAGSTWKLTSIRK